MQNNIELPSTCKKQQKDVGGVVYKFLVRFKYRYVKKKFFAFAFVFKKFVFLFFICLMRFSLVFFKNFLFKI